MFLRRALAQEALGLTHAADADFSRAAHLAAELGAVTPSLGVSLGAVGALHARLRAAEPEFARTLAASLPPDSSRPAPRPLAFDPPCLTKRETLLAGWLGTERTLTEIASALHVSPHTIKSQSRSLYRKLGVGTRTEAVAALDRTGLFPAPADAA
ncbi:helix-turn-helix transcriptional regulator [Xylanimonas allomyrinae]|uniref:helix-turn-helix transcriptional regulator n=1 Tax=Xylanimonas allomyrinae TaxID=2509459 RepID=UPI0013A6139A|nr:helix-turn-helix transcriptional regulator [Xylanimonas allomyrinae]